MLEILKELSRRKVWLFGGLYLALAWVVLQVVIAVESTMELPDWIDKVVLILLFLGFPFALLLSWAHESSPLGPGEQRGTDTDTDGRDRASFVILPFDCFSDDREIEIIADGLIEDLTTLMGRVPDLFVIARNTAYSYKGKSPDLTDIGRELSVRYALEGSVRRSGENLRITTQLIETQTGTHLWAENYDRQADSFIEIQDDLARSIAMQVCSEVTRAEANLAKLIPTANQDALACHLQAKASVLFRGWSKKSFLEAVDLHRRAIELDSNFAPAHAYIALLLALGRMAYFTEDRQAAHDEVLAAAERALDLTPESSEVLGCVGCAYSDLGMHQKGVPLIEKAIEIDATNAQAFAALGAAKIAMLDVESGVADLEHAIKLSPVNAGSAMWKTVLSAGQAALGNDEAALETARQACKDDPNFFAGHLAMTVTLLQQGRKNDARNAVEEARRILPELDRKTVRNFLGAHAEQTLIEAGIEFPGLDPA